MRSSGEVPSGCEAAVSWEGMLPEEEQQPSREGPLRLAANQLREELCLQKKQRKLYQVAGWLKPRGVGGKVQGTGGTRHRPRARRDCRGDRTAPLN